MKITWETGPVAHRGLHDVERGIVENSSAAVSAALEENLAIEVDLQLASDDVAMVFHDFDLDRLVGDHGAVRARSSQDLGRMSYRLGTDRIMTLAELLEMVAGSTPLYVELKSDFTGDMALAHATADLINGYTGPVALMSFDPWIVNACRELCTSTPCGLVSGTFDSDDWDPHATGAFKRFALRHMLTAAIARPAFINYDISAIHAFAPQVFRRFGLPLLTWTVRTDAERKLAATYADAMVFEGFIPTVDERSSHGM